MRGNNTLSPHLLPFCGPELSLRKLLALGNSDLKPIETINSNLVAQSKANPISTGLSK